MASAENGDLQHLSRLDPTEPPAPTTLLAASPDDRQTGGTDKTDKSGARAPVMRDVVATFVIFAAAGTVAGTWFSRILAVRDQLHADLRTLGFVMLCFAIGSLLSMPFTGRLIQRFSVRRVCTVGSIGGCMCLPVLALLNNTMAFSGVLMLTGACWGVWNVTLSVHGAAVEARYGRTILPSLYGALSGGIILGSAGGAMLTAAGVGLRMHFWTVIPPMLAMVLAAIPHWNDPDETAHTAAAHTVESDANGLVLNAGDTPARLPGADTPTGRRTTTLTPQVLLVGMIAFCGNLANGATSDWLAIHAHEDKGLTQGFAAAVFTVLSIAQMIGQFTGGRVVDRIGRVWTLRICGLLAAAGVAATIILPGFSVFIGAALWGLGLSVVEPVALSAAGDIGGAEAPRTIATVSTMGWSAFLIGAPAIGLLAQQISLGSALWAIVGMTLAVSVLATAAAPPRQPGVESSATRA